MSSGNVVDGFSRAVARTPAAPACADGERTISYRELAELVSAMSAALRFDVCTESPVMIEGSRSVLTLAAFLAVLHCGGVPLLADLTLPQERRRRMAEACRPVRRLTPDDLVNLAAARAGGRTEPVDVHPLGLAYLCFTSGSTGVPKGVAMTHRALAARIRWGQSRYPLGVGDRVLWHGGLGFDFTVWEMLAPLCYGACVVAGGGDGQLDLAATADRLTLHRVTAVHFTPSVLRAFLRKAGIGPLKGLRYLFVGGEPFDAALLRDLGELQPVRIFNQYGPAETCIDSTWFECGGQDAADGAGVPIGRPIDGTRTILLNGFGTAGDGATEGELGIAGVGLARGYYGDPRQTAERFIPCPTGPPGERVYRSGDRVRVLADGLLRFQGRLDDQVKINGVRGELGEVRAAVESRYGAGQAVVSTYTDADGELRLVAFVAGAEAASRSAAGAGPGLAESLPAALVPRVVPVTEFLFQDSGKPDVQGMLDAHRPEALVPENPTVARLADIWSGVLSVPAVRPTDDFFELGGHSLLLTEVAARIEGEFAIELPLRDLFDCDSLRQMADLIDALSASSSSAAGSCE